MAKKMKLEAPAAPAKGVAKPKKAATATAPKATTATAAESTRQHRSRGDNPNFNMKQAKTAVARTILEKLVEVGANIRTAPGEAHFSVLVGEANKNAMNVINGKASVWIGFLHTSSLDDFYARTGLTAKDCAAFGLRLAGGNRWVELRDITDENTPSAKVLVGIGRFAKWAASNLTSGRAKKEKSAAPAAKATKGAKTATAKPAAKPGKAKKKMTV